MRKISSVLVFFGLNFAVFVPAPVWAVSERVPKSPSNPRLSTTALKKTLSRSYVALSPHTRLLLENKVEKKLLVKDYLSSTRSVLDKSGKGLSTQAYYPFGLSKSSDSLKLPKAGEPTDHLFTGHRQITSASVYQAGARFYSPTLGLFLQPDTVEGPNRYAYGANNPVRFNDPSGNMPVNGGYQEAPFVLDYESGPRRLNELFRRQALLFLTPGGVVEVAGKKQLVLEEILEKYEEYKEQNAVYQIARASRLKGENDITGQDILEAKTADEVVGLITLAVPNSRVIFFKDSDYGGRYDPFLNSIFIISSDPSYAPPELEELFLIEAAKHESIHCLNWTTEISRRLRAIKTVQDADFWLDRMKVIKKIGQDVAFRLNDEAMAYGSTATPEYDRRIPPEYRDRAIRNVVLMSTLGHDSFGPNVIPY